MSCIFKNVSILHRAICVHNHFVVVSADGKLCSTATKQEKLRKFFFALGTYNSEPTQVLNLLQAGPHRAKIVLSVTPRYYILVRIYTLALGFSVWSCKSGSNDLKLTQE